MKKSVLLAVITTAVIFAAGCDRQETTPTASPATQSPTAPSFELPEGLKALQLGPVATETIDDFMSLSYYDYGSKDEASPIFSEAQDFAPYVGYWILADNDSPYRYDESYEISGLIIYYDKMFRYVNARGVPSSYVQPFDERATLTYRADDLLEDAEGHLYVRIGSPAGEFYPAAGVPSECLGEYRCEDSAAGLRDFLIDRDGSLFLIDADYNFGTTTTESDSTFTIMLDGADITMDYFNIESGYLTDAAGNYYYKVN